MIEQFFRVREIGEKVIWFRGREFRPAMPSRFHNHGLGPNGPGTTHVEWRIADNPNIMRIDPRSNVTCNLGKRAPSDIVAIRQAIGEGTEREEIPEPKVPKFNLCSGPDISRQQADRNVFPLSTKRRLNAREHRSRMCGQSLGKLGKIFGLQPFDIVIGWIDGVNFQKLASDPRIGSAAVSDLIANLAHSKGISERGFHGGLAGSAAANESAIDVEE